VPAHTRAGASALRPQAPDVVLVVHHRDERGVAGRRAIDQTNLTRAVAAVISSSTDAGHRCAAKTTGPLPLFEGRGCLRNSFQPCGATAFSWFG
jgi:hypothetical protein